MDSNTLLMLMMCMGGRRNNMLPLLLLMSGGLGNSTSTSGTPSNILTSSLTPTNMIMAMLPMPLLAKLFIGGAGTVVASSLINGISNRQRRKRYNGGKKVIYVNRGYRSYGRRRY